MAVSMEEIIIFITIMMYFYFTGVMFDPTKSIPAGG